MGFLLGNCCHPASCLTDFQNTQACLLQKENGKNSEDIEVFRWRVRPLSARAHAPPARIPCLPVPTLSAPPPSPSGTAMVSNRKRFADNTGTTVLICWAAGQPWAHWPLCGAARAQCPRGPQRSGRPFASCEPQVGNIPAGESAALETRVGETQSQESRFQTVRGSPGWEGTGTLCWIQARGSSPSGPGVPGSISSPAHRAVATTALDPVTRRLRWVM